MKLLHYDRTDTSLVKLYETKANTENEQPKNQ